ncbi:MAG: UpxY family transcription antiterminator [Candidatus Cloacimonetes bacterium]|nr:UpxY family transcription antiterminator [Candidatus Cloacimonadota bacterium]
MVNKQQIEIRELAGDLEPGDGITRWFVIYTKSRREKKLAEYAYRRDINYYLPLQESVRHYKYRKLTFTKPLFPGYIFVKVNDSERQSLIISGHTVSFLKVRDESEFLSSLRQIYTGREQGAEFHKTEYLEEGTRVKITKGPFTGLTGVVKNQNNVREVILQIDLLRQAVSVAVTPEQVSIIE